MCMLCIHKALVIGPTNYTLKSKPLICLMFCLFIMWLCNKHSSVTCFVWSLKIQHIATLPACSLNMIQNESARIQYAE